jgi:hypothetical protein
MDNAIIAFIIIKNIISLKGKENPKILLREIEHGWQEYEHRFW